MVRRKSRVSRRNKVSKRLRTERRTNRVNRRKMNRSRKVSRKNRTKRTKRTKRVNKKRTKRLNRTRRVNRQRTRTRKIKGGALTSEELIKQLESPNSEIVEKAKEDFFSNIDEYEAAEEKKITGIIMAQLKHARAMGEAFQMTLGIMQSEYQNAITQTEKHKVLRRAGLLTVSAKDIEYIIASDIGLWQESLKGMGGAGNVGVQTLKDNLGDGVLGKLSLDTKFPGIVKCITKKSRLGRKDQGVEMYLVYDDVNELLIFDTEQGAKMNVKYPKTNKGVQPDLRTYLDTLPEKELKPILQKVHYGERFDKERNLLELFSLKMRSQKDVQKKWRKTEGAGAGYGQSPNDVIKDLLLYDQRHSDKETPYGIGLAWDAESGADSPRNSKLAEKKEKKEDPVLGEMIQTGNLREGEDGGMTAQYQLGRPFISAFPSHISIPSNLRKYTLNENDDEDGNFSVTLSPPNGGNTTFSFDDKRLRDYFIHCFNVNRDPQREWGVNQGELAAAMAVVKEAAAGAGEVAPAKLTDKEQVALDDNMGDAAGNGETEKVLGFLKEGANPNAEDSWGDGSVLYRAAGGNHIEIMEALIDAEADIDKREAQAEKQTPLIHAASKGHTAAVELLLEKKADWTLRTNTGISPLAVAAIYGHVECMEVLSTKVYYVVDNLDETDNSGKTPLIHAASNGHTAAVKWLLEKGADWTLKDKDGKTAIDVAEEQRHVDAEAVLVARIEKHRIDIEAICVDEDVHYRSETHGGWIPAKMGWVNYNEQIVLDIKEGADPDRIRRKPNPPLCNPGKSAWQQMQQARADYERQEARANTGKE